MDTSAFELTLEQQFHVRLMEQSTERLSREQMQELLIQTAKLLMVKDNVIRNLMRNSFLG
jgi:hypothetical protein